MIERVILLKFDGGTTTEQILQAVKRFQALQSVLSGVKEMRGGLNVSERGHGYQVVLAARFDDQAALDAYEANPEHHACSAYVREIGRKDGIVVDYIV